LNDELNAPLGLGSDRDARGAKGGAGIFALAAALVAFAVAFGEVAFLRGDTSWTTGGGAAFRREPVAAPADPPPLRLTQSFEAPAKPPPAADLAAPAAPSLAKPPRSRAGALEPLIIDVQQALAALRAKDSAAAQR
jgi:hypothetical protein